MISKEQNNENNFSINSETPPDFWEKQVYFRRCERLFVDLDFFGFDPVALFLQKKR